MNDTEIAVRNALASLGGHAFPWQIRDHMIEIGNYGKIIRADAGVRRTVQCYCPEAPHYRGNEKLFINERYNPGSDPNASYEWRLRPEHMHLAYTVPASDDEDPDFGPEGRRKLVRHWQMERSRELVDRFKGRLKSFACVVSKFDFEAYYGLHGERFIEAHHIVPLAKLDASRKPLLSDLTALCANCHRMAHRKLDSTEELPTIQQLKAMVASRHL